MPSLSLKQGAQLALIVGLGSLQMIGDVADLPALKAAGLISHVSPAPKVFTAQNGYETYSPEFFVSALNTESGDVGIQLTPEVNARVRGPYNRRNAYGAALSYGPVLYASDATRPMFSSAFRYAVCSADGVRHEVGLPAAERYRVDIRARRDVSAAQKSEWPNRFEIDCSSGEIIASNSSEGERS